MADKCAIYEAIPAILSDVEAISKNRKNQQQGYSFRGIDDVYNAIHPLLAKHKVFPTCEILSREMTERETKSGGALFYVNIKAKYTLWASDGSNVATEAWGEAMDSGDKASNKAMSAAYKYALFQLLCIPTEAVDAEQDTPEPAPRRQKPERPPPLAGSEMTTKDNKIIAQVVQMFAEVQSEADYTALMDLLKKPDSAPNKADHPDLVKKQIWLAIKNHQHEPKKQPEPDYEPVEA
jgi:hypothetical protein